MTSRRVNMRLFQWPRLATQIKFHKLRFCFEQSWKNMGEKEKKMTEIVATKGVVVTS